MITGLTSRVSAIAKWCAAPLQECVGRLGGVPHGIEVLTAADYFTLSSRSQAGQLTPRAARGSAVSARGKLHGRGRIARIPVYSCSTATCSVRRSSASLARQLGLQSPSTALVIDSRQVRAMNKPA